MESNRCIKLFVERSKRTRRRSKKVVSSSPKNSWQLVGGGSVGRVWWRCEARQLRRKELAKVEVVEILGLEGG